MRPVWWVGALQGKLWFGPAREFEDGTVRLVRLRAAAGLISDGDSVPDQRFFPRVQVAQGLGPRQGFGGVAGRRGSERQIVEARGAGPVARCRKGCRCGEPVLRRVCLRLGDAVRDV